MLRKRHRALGLAVVAVAASAAMLALAPLPAFGDTTGTLNATVTVASACLLLDQEQVDFGTLAFNTPNSNNFGQTTTLHVANCAGTSESVLVHGTDATGANSAATWTLYDTFGNPCNVGVNKYQVQYQNRDDENNITGFNLTNTSQTAATGVTDSHAYRLTLLMPCTGSDGAGDTMTFQTVFTATF